MTRWWSATVGAGREDLESAADLLYAVGAAGIEFEDGVPVHSPWTDESLSPGPAFARAYYPDDERWPDRHRRLAAAAGRHHWPLAVRAVQEEDWALAWRAYYHAVRPGRRLWVVPAWEEPAADVDPRLVIRLDPGMAFGTGTHATTAMMLRLVEDRVGPGQRWLDVGTGSGILALGAWRLGALVTAVEPDPVACRQAAANFKLHGAPIPLLEGTLAQVPGGFRYEGIMANLTAGLLIQEMDALVDHVEPGGWLLLSGIVLSRESSVHSALRRHQVRCFDRLVEGGWVALAGRVAAR